MYNENTEKLPWKVAMTCEYTLMLLATEDTENLALLHFKQLYM